MGTKVWLVCERGWEYDDNNYYCNDEGGSPVKGYRSEDAAKKAAQERNFNRIQELILDREILSYLRDDGWGGLVPDNAGPDLQRLLIQYGVNITTEYGDYELPENGLPDAFWDKLRALKPGNLFYTTTWVVLEDK